MEFCLLLLSPSGSLSSDPSASQIVCFSSASRLKKCLFCSNVHPPQSMATKEPHFEQKILQLGSSEDWNFDRLGLRRTCGKILLRLILGLTSFVAVLFELFNIATIVSRSVNYRATWESSKENSKSPSLCATCSAVAIEDLSVCLLLIFSGSSRTRIQRPMSNFVALRAFAISQKHSLLIVFHISSTTKSSTNST